MSRRGHRHLRPGFSLVELIAASVIIAMIAGGSVVALSRAVRSRDAAAGRYDAFSRASSAVEAIARDLQNAVRDADLRHAKVAVSPGGASGAERDQLLLVVESLRPVRPNSPQAEAPTAEVQYKLEDTDAGAILWKRIDPLPDIYPDAGGVATPMVPGIISLAIEASDGTAWFEDWDSDNDGHPHLVRVTVVAQSDDGVRQAAARRTIALDRVPLPGSLAAAQPEAEPAAQPSGGAATGGDPSGAGAGGAGRGAAPGGIRGGGQPGGQPGTRPGGGRGQPGGGQPGGGQPGGGQPGGGRPGGTPPGDRPPGGGGGGGGGAPRGGGGG